MSKMAVLLHQLDGEDAYFAAVDYDEHNQITKLFLSSTGALKTFKQKPDIILLDCTYKTNRYNMPPLNIISITGSNTTIHLAHCYLNREDKDAAYNWIFTQLKEAFLRYDFPQPRLILTDRSLAHINPVEGFFPGTSVLLYLWQVSKQYRRMPGRDAFVKYETMRQSR